MPYDDNNRGAAWKIGAVSGKAQIEGREYYLSIVATGQAKPSHRYFLQEKNGDGVIAGVLFKDDEGKNRHSSGSATVDGVQYWMSVFVNKSDHPQSPAFDVSFQPKEQRPSQQPHNSNAEFEQADAMGGDDIPF